MSDFSDAIAEPRWYVAHTYSGYENKVKANLEQIIENRNLQEKIMEVRIPVEISIEKKGEEEKEIETKVFPSYVFIKMIMSDETWHVVRNIRGVTGFVGPGSKPVPLSEEEVASLGVEQRIQHLDYAVGDSVTIAAGPLEGFVGTVAAISEDLKKVTVIASMFGRETPVDLESSEVKPLQL
jgi:transcriptional antiterminator NusG